MKKLLPLGLAVGLALLPLSVFAAYNDVSLAEGVALSVGGITLNVSGSADVVESITVDSSSFSFVLQQNSTLKIIAPNGNQIDDDASSAYKSAAECKSGSSFTTYLGGPNANSKVITVTPSTSTCPRANSGGSSQSGTSGGGGGYVAPVVTPVTLPANPTAADLQAKLNALLTQLNALQSPAGVAPGLINAAKVHIEKILSKGSNDPSVKGLQQFLNKHGFVISATGVGSPGKETNSYGTMTAKAVGKFQEKYGLAKPGDPGYGVVGPKTRAKINEISSGE